MYSGTDEKRSHRDINIKPVALVSWMRYASGVFDRRPEFQVSGLPHETEMHDFKLVLEVTGKESSGSGLEN
jgi:hypothetical protein